MSVRTIVLWGAAEDPVFVDRYRAEHLPLVRALPGLVDSSASPLRSRSYSIVAELSFADIESLKAAFASEEGQALIEHTQLLERDFGVTATSLTALPEFD